jgi:hypothetical protein
LSKVVKTEGVTALWKGMAASPHLNLNPILALFLCCPVPITLLHHCGTNRFHALLLAAGSAHSADIHCVGADERSIQPVRRVGFWRPLLQPASFRVYIQTLQKHSLLKLHSSSAHQVFHFFAFVLAEISSSDSSYGKPVFKRNVRPNLLLVPSAHVNPVGRFFPLLSSALFSLVTNIPSASPPRPRSHTPHVSTRPVQG